MSRFDTCYAIIDSPDIEGGYVNHPLDGGGATMRGVTQETYDRYRQSLGFPTQPVRDITSSEVVAIYRKYWDDAHCDQIPAPLDLLVFDVAINSGPKKAIILLQRALGMRPEHHTGNFGSITTRTLADAIDYIGTLGLCDDYLDERIRFYKARVAFKPDQAVFLDGWLRRVAIMAQHAGIDKGATT